LASKSPLTHPEVASLDAKAAQITASAELELARDRKVIDFIQLRYGNLPGQPLRNEASIGLGLSVPWRGSRQARKDLLKIEAFEVEQSKRRALAALKADMDKANSELEQLHAAWAATRQSIQLADQRYQIDKVAASDENGIELILEHMTLQTKRQAKALKLETEIRQRYVDLLYLSGQLSTQPIVNYLQRR
jgi:hypothetical protein